MPCIYVYHDDDVCMYEEPRTPREHVWNSGRGRSAGRVIVHDRFLNQCVATTTQASGTVCASPAVEDQISNRSRARVVLRSRRKLVHTYMYYSRRRSWGFFGNRLTRRRSAVICRRNPYLFSVMMEFRAPPPG